MSYIPRYDHGDWIADCDVCGRKFKASKLVRRWDGLMCCEEDWEIRQPQDFVRGVADTQIAPWLRPEPSDSFILACTTRSSLAGYAQSGCAISGNTVDPGYISQGTF